ncbi:hypothetical protein ACHQM5_007456 [Ranunculus cassubicifolius]
MGSTNVEEANCFTTTSEQELKLISDEDCAKKQKMRDQGKDIMGEVYKTHEAIYTVDNTISSLQMELAATRTAHSKKLDFLLNIF